MCVGRDVATGVIGAVVACVTTVDSDGRISNMLRRFGTMWGRGWWRREGPMVLPTDADDARSLLQIFSGAYERWSMDIAANLDLSSWGRPLATSRWPPR